MNERIFLCSQQVQWTNTQNTRVFINKYHIMATFCSSCGGNNKGNVITSSLLGVHTSSITEVIFLILQYKNALQANDDNKITNCLALTKNNHTKKLQGFS